MSKACCFTGHRPDGLYGYNLSNPKYKNLAYEIKQKCKDLIKDKNIDTFISGGALGLDIIAFFIVEVLKKEYPDIKNVLAAPFKYQPVKWTEVDILRYNKMKRLADEIIYVDKLEEYNVKGLESDTYHPRKMQKRNEYMVDNSDIVIAVWNENKKGGTYNCVKYATNKQKEIILINPNNIE